LLKPRLHVAHPVREGQDGLSCATDMGAVIVLSWSVQAVNSQESVEELESELASYLARHAGLNESGVGAGGCLDEDDPETQ
jgi:hypothetical protein